MTFTYHINLDERGYFSADVRDDKDNTIFQISSTEEAIELQEYGFITDFYDINQIESHLKQNHFLDDDDFLTSEDC